MTYFQAIHKSLLIVELDAEKRNLLLTYFKKGVECDAVDSLEAAVDSISKHEYSAVLAPLMPPELKGLELISKLERLSPNTVPIFTSEIESAGNTVKAYRAGAFDVVQMPMSLQKLETSVERAFIQYEMRSLRDRYRNQLESEVAIRTFELEQTLEEVERSYRMTLSAVVRALEQREFESEGHSERAITFSLRLGHELGLETETLRDLELGALLHDVGKINVSDDVLRKAERLNTAEWASMKRHPQLGHEILAGIPFLEGASRIVAEHHECWDGSGYPFGLRGEEIAIGARILSVVDAFEAMITERVYRKSRSYDEALTEIDRFSGTQFDPLVVEAFRNVPYEDWEFLHERSLQGRMESQSFQTIVADLVFARRGLQMVH
jgi:response regulator RpfG family c-di-GMP phosphodiesterase